MSVRTVTCPQCRKRVNVPATLVNARCSSCGTVWNTHQPDGGTTAGAGGAGAESRAGSAGNSRGKGIWLGVGAAVVALITIGVASALVMWPDSDTASTPDPQASAEDDSATTVSSAPSGGSEAGGQPDSATEASGARAASATDAESMPATPEPEYRVVDLPEPTRREIYDDYREAARTTREKPLPLFQDSAPRSAMERMLQETLDREIRRLAALHDISVNDIKQIIAEGDAKGWDPTPRSNARRDGEPVNPASR
jgi:hypothetical protein